MLAVPCPTPQKNMLSWRYPPWAACQLLLESCLNCGYPKPALVSASLGAALITTSRVVV